MKKGTLTPADLANVPKLTPTDVKLLWISDYYDGPISGVVEVDGERLLFDLVDYDALGTHNEERVYWLIRLSEAQLREEVYWHEAFCRHVGTNFDYTGRPPLDPNRADADWNAFYIPYQARTSPDYRDNEVLGWFRF